MTRLSSPHLQPRSCRQREHQHVTYDISRATAQEATSFSGFSSGFIYAFGHFYFFHRHDAPLSLPSRISSQLEHIYAFVGHRRLTLFSRGSKNNVLLLTLREAMS